MTVDDEFFDIYVRTYGKVQSGSKLETKDYGTQGLDGFVPFSTDGKLAVSMAAEDVNSKVPMRSKPQMLARLRSLTAGGPSALEVASLARPSPQMIGNWAVVRPLKRGAQGEVLLVERARGAEHAVGVLKRVPAEVADDAKRLGRFKHEMEIVRELRHPFIAELLEVNFDQRWFVTRYAPLGSLQDHLAWFTGDAWRTLRMARDIAVALGIAHAAKVIHRDVKPGNIVLYDPNHVALADFGIAHAPDQTGMTSTDEKVGASWYRPPEAEDGRHEPTPTFDVYMLGKVIYTAITGGKRFRREGFATGEANIEKMFGRPEFAAVNKLFGRMIVENPGDRFQDTAAVVAAVDSALAEIFGKGIVDANAHTDAIAGDVAKILARLASLEQTVQAQNLSTSHLKERVDVLSEWTGDVRSQFREIVGEVNALANASANNPGGRYVPNWKLNQP